MRGSVLEEILGSFVVSVGNCYDKPYRPLLSATKTKLSQSAHQTGAI